MTDRVARLWLDHGLAPSETIICPPAVLGRVTRLINQRGEEAAEQAADAEFRADAERMHQQLKEMG